LLTRDLVRGLDARKIHQLAKPASYR
jgi:hypothetical protein